MSEFVANQKIHFPGLNAFRFLAAFFVIVNHVEWFKYYLKIPSISNTFLHQALGTEGVNIFFTISGFLITYLLLKEKAQISGINIKNFYIRRILRIHPLYYVIVVLGFLVGPSFRWWYADMPQMRNIADVFGPEKSNFGLHLTFYLLMVPNLPMNVFKSALFANQAWSVGVEEQFYLIWPHVVKRARNLIYILIAIVMGKLMVQGLVYQFWHEEMMPYNFKTSAQRIYNFMANFRIEFMAVGGIGAFLYTTHAEFLKKHLLSPYLQKFSLPALFLALWASRCYLTASTLFPAAIYTILILNVVMDPDERFIGHSRIVEYLGRISYGLYMYHVFVIIMILALAEKYFGDNLVSTFTRFPIGANLVLYATIVASTILISAISFHFFEARFLRLKSKYGTQSAS